MRSCIRKWRAKHSASNDTKAAAPKAGRTGRSYDFSKAEDVRAFNHQMGFKDLNREPIGYTQGHILTGDGR